MPSSVLAATSKVRSSRLADRLLGSSSNIYTVEQLKRILLVHNPKIPFPANDMSKLLAPWWRSFEYVTVKNESDEFERINSFIGLMNFQHGMFSTMIV